MKFDFSLFWVKVKRIVKKVVGYIFVFEYIIFNKYSSLFRLSLIKVKQIYVDNIFKRRDVYYIEIICCLFIIFFLLSYLDIYYIFGVEIIEFIF